MATGLYSSSSFDESYAELRTDLTHAVVPALIAAGVVLVLVAEQMHWPWEMGLIGDLLIALPLVALFISRSAAKAATWLAVGVVWVAVLLAVHWFPASGAACLFVVPAVLACLLISDAGGMAVGALSSVVIYAAGQQVTGDTSWLAPLVALWAVLLGVWAMMRHSRGAFHALWTSYQDAHRLLDEARDQRLELKQAREDLVQANTAMARLTDRLKQINQEAQEARRVKEEFASNVSHELRTPLNMIIGFSEMISQQPDMYGVELPSSLLADIAVIRRNSEHLAALVDDVLDLSQIDAGHMALSKEWIDLADVVDAALVAVQPLFEAKHLSLVAEVPKDLPALYADRTRLRQVLLNILSNAGRFTQAGGVTVTAYRDGNNLVTSIADTGPGIAPKDQQRIFKPFEQLDGSIRRRFGGSGLGLAISRCFVEMHGGRMWLESQVGQGTTFCISVPISDDAPPEADGFTRWFSQHKTYEPRTMPSRAPAPKPAPRFVVVEQDGTLEHLLGRYLAGIEVTSVPDPEQALREVRLSPPRAVIINDPAVQLGLSEAEHSTALPYGTPVIRCWVPGRREAAEQLGVMQYLVKPVSCAALLSALGALGTDTKTILLVDDNPEVLHLYTRLLTSAERGYRVLRAASGPRALAMLRDQKPDAMLLDLVMPGMDGHAVLRAKSQDPLIANIPVIVVSAQDALRQALVTNQLAVQRSGGLTARDLLACVTALSEVLSPDAQPGGRERSEKPGD